MTDDGVCAETTTEPAAEPDARKRGRLHGWKATIAACVFLAFVLANTFISLPYFILSPGDTKSVNQYVELPDDRDNPPKGQIMLTTVAIARAHPLDMAWAWATDGTEIVKKKLILGTSTPQQFNDISAKQMTGSQLAAKYVALQRAGLNVTLTGQGATIRALSDGSPAVEKLAVGDTITAVDGVPVKLAPEVSAAIRTRKVGDSVAFTVQNAAGETRSVTIATVASPQDGARAYVGVSIETKGLDLVTPFPVGFTVTDIGGPSAGLAFTLALLDDLTPGELTGGGKIAATGTMDGDGNVGEVGGVEQKTRSVRESGATMFLVPSSEVDEAKRFAGSKLKVVGVNTLEDAISALRDGGGDTSGLPAGITLKPGV